MFVKAIQFGADEKCFEQNGKIEFHDEQSPLIDFYLKTTSKKVKNGGGEFNFSDRFRINCILGNNGGGKTKFLSSILHFFHADDRWEFEDKSLIMKGVGKSKKDKVFKIKQEGYSLDRNSHSELKKLRKAGVCCIFDDFFVGSDMFRYSVNKEVLLKMLEERGLNEFFCKINDFLLSDGDNYRIFQEFLNIKGELKHEFLLDWNFSRKEEGIDTLVFWEEDNKTENEYDGMIDNENILKELLETFKFLHQITTGKLDSAEKNCPQIFKAINEPDMAKEIWFATSDLFLAMINGLRTNLQNYHIQSDPEEFIKQTGYKEFREALELLVDYFEEVSKDSNLTTFVNKMGNSVGPMHSKKYANAITKLSEVQQHLSDFLGILRLLEKGGYKEASYNCEQKFKLGLHEVLKRISGYESPRVQASPFFLTELLFGFSSKNRIENLKFGSVLNTSIRYGIIIPSKERLDTKKASFSPCKKFNSNEIKIFESPVFRLDLKFQNCKKPGMSKFFKNLSSGEKIMLIRFANVYYEIIDKYRGQNYKHFIVLIDEPDLHLHLEWQRKYMQRLIDVFSTLELPDATFHFILATHSPFIISDIAAANIVMLERVENTSISKKYDGKSFGATYLDLLKKGFFQDDVLLGSFSSDVIKNMAKCKAYLDFRKAFPNMKVSLPELDNEGVNLLDYIQENPDQLESLKLLIGDDFIADNLSYFNHFNSYAITSD